MAHAPPPDIRETLPIFGFELESVDSLRLMPLVIRFNLDRVGIKLSLRQWSCFSAEERRQLVAQRCDTPVQMENWRRTLVELIVARTHESVVEVAVESAPLWAEESKLPEPVRAGLEMRGLPVPGPDRWRTLRPLQRFALLKLTRPGREGADILPALREFGLAR